MKLKRFLIFAPILLVLGLLQSYFWVPSYETQTRGNPQRLSKFIEASIGDAKILNPILNADTASSRIAGLVFEGLLDLDENLNLRGRLATAWEIREQVFLTVNDQARLPDGTPVTAVALLERIQNAIKEGPLESLGELITDIELLPPTERFETINVPGPDGTATEARLRIAQPERIQFNLNEVNQDFFTHLEPIIGSNYAAGFLPGSRIQVTPQALRKSAQPHFAQQLPLFEHNPEILFHLRQGVHFHDGHPFDAGDVKFTYDAIMNPKNLSPRTSDFEPIKTVEILDPYRVRVIYKRLFSPAINAWTMGILPEHRLNDQAMQLEMDRRGISLAGRETFGMRDSAFNRNPIGVGPFRFNEWQSDELIHLNRNEAYWETPPQYRDYYFRIIPDPLTQEVEFRTGAIDAYAPQPHQVARYKENDAYQAFSSLGFGYSYIGYNNRRPLFADKRVRLALSMALNIDEIIQYVLYGEGERITGPYPKNTDWYDHGIQPVPYDPEGAQRILEELGWRKNADGWLEKDGQLFEFNLITNNGNLIRKAILTIAQNSWRKLGIKCNTQLFEWAVFLQDFINPGDFDAVVLGWSMGIDPDLYQLWHSSQAGANQLNFVGYANPEADALIERIRREYDRDRQLEQAHRLHQLIAEDQPYTFLFAGLGTRVLDKKIVMITEEDGIEKLKAARSGDLFFHFKRWRKLEFTPDL
jgi:ABC-type transport system substrate-binding protein